MQRQLGIAMQIEIKRLDLRVGGTNLFSRGCHPGRGTRLRYRATKEQQASSKPGKKSSLHGSSRGSADIASTGYFFAKRGPGVLKLRSLSVGMFADGQSLGNKRFRFLVDVRPSP